MSHFLIYFTDPVLRAPTIGCMLMCLSAALVGVFAFLKKQSLLGEALSHAAFPGVMLGVIGAGFFAAQEIAYLVILGAIVSALIGVYAIHYLQSRYRLHADAALCFVLSVFFGIGVTLASRLQFSHTNLYQRSLIYLYGQAATMTDRHIYLYGALSLLVLFLIFIFYKELKIICFDREYASSLGVPVKGVEALFFTLIVIAIIVGIRSVGVVLMSAMLIAPAVAARQFTNHLSVLFVLAGLFGLLSGYLGNYLSVEMSRFNLVLPTGPMIVMVASVICFIALLIAPKRGLIIRFFRIVRFRDSCLAENILKSFWRHGEGMTKKQIASLHTISEPYLSLLLYRLTYSGWLKKEKGAYTLTKEGNLRAAKIVRLHRLWEVYLVNYLGVGSERVHHNAEEMEHIITPEVEKELTKLLHNPTVDPHKQPIPPREAL